MSNEEQLAKKKEVRRIATEQWEELPTTIIVNEEVKVINAYKEEGRKKLNRKGMNR
jgi:hypothetical protein